MSALFLAPLVIANRLPQLWFEALHPNPMVSDESRLAVTEKIAAFSEGMVAGQMAALSVPMAVLHAMMRGRAPLFAALDAQQGVMKASVAPIEKRLRHNARRLSRPLRQRSRSTKA